MFVLYLDHDYYSRIANACLGRNSDDDAMRLLATAWSLVDHGQLVCPFSISHIWATAEMTDEDLRNELTAIIDRLSIGRCLRWAPQSRSVDIDPIGYGARHIRSIRREDDVDALTIPHVAVFRSLVNAIRATSRLRERPSGGKHFTVTGDGPNAPKERFDTDATDLWALQGVDLVGVKNSAKCQMPSGDRLSGAKVANSFRDILGALSSATDRRFHLQL